MQVGDLVYLNPIYFYEYDECVGIIVEVDVTRKNGLYKVAWMDDSHGEEFGWFNEDELEVINEGR